MPWKSKNQIFGVELIFLFPNFLLYILLFICIFCWCIFTVYLFMLKNFIIRKCFTAKYRSKIYKLCTKCWIRNYDKALHIFFGKVNTLREMILEKSYLHFSSSFVFVSWIKMDVSEIYLPNFVQFSKLNLREKRIFK